jgi:hypothetical protein
VSGAGVLLASLTLAVEPASKGANAPPGLTWVRQLGDEGRDEAGQALAWDPQTDSVVVAGISTPPGRPEEAGSFWVRRVDSAGQVRRTTAIPHERGQGPVNSSYRYVGGLAVLANGGLLLVVELGERRPVLLRLDASDRVVASKVIAEHSTRITRLVPADAGRYLLFGTQGLDALAMKVDADAQAIWTRHYDRGDTEGFDDAVATDDGGFLAVATARGDNPSAGERVWVVRAGADGLRQADVVFSGRGPALSRAPDGTYRLVYDAQIEAFAHDMRLLSLGPALETLAKSSLLPREPGFPVRLGIVARPRGGFLVAGAKGLGLWLGRVDADGRLAWSWSDGPEQPWRAPGHAAGWHLDIQACAASRDAVYVLTTVQRAGAPDKGGRQVGLLKLGES